MANSIDTQVKAQVAMLESRGLKADYQKIRNAIVIATSGVVHSS